MGKQDAGLLAGQNIKLVHYVINSYFFANKNTVGLEYDDLFQVGCLGLIKAAEKFEPGKGFKFNAFADKIIRLQICSHLKSVLRKQAKVCGAEITENFLPYEYNFDSCLVESELLELLDNIKRTCKGSRLKGVEVIKLLVQGYDNKKIAEIFGTSVKNIYNWRCLAKKELLKNKFFLEYFEKV